MVRYVMNSEQMYGKALWAISTDVGAISVHWKTDKKGHKVVRLVVMHDRINGEHVDVSPPMVCDDIDFREAKRMDMVE